MSQKTRVEKLEGIDNHHIVTLSSNNLEDLSRRAGALRSQGKKPICLYFPGIDFSKLPTMPGEKPTLINGIDDLDYNSLPD